MVKKKNSSFFVNNVSNKVIITLLLVMVFVSLVVLGAYINNLNKVNAKSFQAVNQQESLNSKAVEIKPAPTKVVLSSGEVGVKVVQKVK